MAESTVLASAGPLVGALPPQPLRPQPLRTALALAQREVVRFFRQRNRIIGSIGTPLLFWLLFGAGLSRSFRLGDDAAGPSFLEYYFPGSLVLILMFTSIFSSISIIEDRREGFLQSVLVAPLPRWSMVLGKALGGTFVAAVQGAIFLLLAWTLPIQAGLADLAALAAFLLATSLALTSLGFAFAWRMESSQGFHAVMNLALMPMWLLSGGFFPIPALTAETSWSQWLLGALMRVNPLTYAVAGVRESLFGELAAADVWSPGLGMCWGVTLAFAALAFAAAAAVSRQRTTGDLL